MDGYHLEKRLKELSVRFPSRGVRSRLTEAIKAGERKKADKIVQSLYEIAEDDKESGKINEFGKYLMGNWEATENRKTLNIPGELYRGTGKSCVIRKVQQRSALV